MCTLDELVCTAYCRGLLLQNDLTISGYASRRSKQGLECPCTLDNPMCIFKVNMIESTVLDIQNPTMTSRKQLLEFSGHSTKGDLQNSLCMPDNTICTFKAYVLESTLLDIMNTALTYGKHIIKVSGHSTKGDLQNNLCSLDILMCTFKAYMLESTLLDIQTLL